MLNDHNLLQTQWIVAEDSGFARGGGVDGDSGFARELSRQSFLHSCAMIRVIIVSLSQLSCPTFVLECVCVRVCVRALT